MPFKPLEPLDPPEPLESLEQLEALELLDPAGAAGANWGRALLLLSAATRRWSGASQDPSIDNIN
jgi:hypothetical protein